MPRALKGVGIGLGALVLSSLATQAHDVWRGIDTSLTALTRDTATPCSAGAVLFLASHGPICVDVYEASADTNCHYATPEDQTHTARNVLDPHCQVVSAPGVIPWRFVSLTEAQQLCARSGKRLPTGAEWYRLALLVADPTHCTTNNTGPVPTGSTECVSTTGVHDLVGNVWEWVDGSVTDGVYTGRSLPTSGFVTGVDNNGIVLTTSSTSDPTYGNDYAWTAEQGTYGILRGGFFGSGADAGVFAQNLAAAFDLRTSGVGFRCVQDV